MQFENPFRSDIKGNNVTAIIFFNAPRPQFAFGIEAFYVNFDSVNRRIKARTGKRVD